MVLQGVAGLSGNSGKENQRGWSEAIIQERKRMRTIGGRAVSSQGRGNQKQNKKTF